MSVNSEIKLCYDCLYSVTKSRTHVTKLYTPVTKRRTPVTKRRTPVTKLIELRYGIARYNVTECFEDLIPGYVLQAGRLRNR